MKTSTRSLIIFGFVVICVIVFQKLHQSVPKEYGSPDTLQIDSEHVATDSHSLATIIEESGLGDLIRNEGLSAQSSYIAGTCGIGRSDQEDVFNLFEPDDEFRLGLSLVTKSGKVIPDFFSGIADANTKDTIINGHKNYIRTLNFDGITNKAYADQFFPKQTSGTITLKKFNRHTFYLKDVPEGTAYFWFQFPIDGNKVTQVPMKVIIHPKMGKIVRLDLNVDLTKTILFF